MRTQKQLLSKYLLCSAAAGALAIAPMAASAQDTTMSTTTTTTTTMSEPTMVSGSVVRYYVDQTGYVTAMDVQTANGVQMVTFPANRATTVYNMYPVGGNVDVWVSPGSTTGQWTVVGTGKDRPQVWWNTAAASGVDWLRAEPYFEAGAKQTSLSGSLKGIVTDHNGEILALVLGTGNGRSLVRVPPQVRQVAPGYEGDERIAQLFKGSRVDVVGTPEAPRRGGLLGRYNWVLAASSLRINGKSVGAIGIPAVQVTSDDALLGWNVGGPDNLSEEEKRASVLGYSTYTPLGSTPAPAVSTSTTTTTTTTTTSDTATGKVMIVAADGTMMPVVRKGDKIHMQAADGTLTQIKKKNGKFVLPENMTGARMIMLMSDGTQMNMDTVNGQLMVVTADGSMAPVTLHTP